MCLLKTLFNKVVTLPRHNILILFVGVSWRSALVTHSFFFIRKN